MPPAFSRRRSLSTCKSGGQVTTMVATDHVQYSLRELIQNHARSQGWSADLHEVRATTAILHRKIIRVSMSGVVEANTRAECDESSQAIGGGMLKA
eukprot:scaffold121752_cov29-Tisochrysis_lutea.AAC.6